MAGPTVVIFGDPGGADWDTGLVSPRAVETPPDAPIAIRGEESVRVDQPLEGWRKVDPFFELLESLGVPHVPLGKRAFVVMTVLVVSAILYLKR